MDFFSCLFILSGKNDKTLPDEKAISRKPAAGTVSEEAKTETKTHISYGPIYIYFGSQTGTAANYAKILGQEAAENGFQPKLVDLIDFDPKRLQTIKLALFVMATHGDGDPTDNAVGFNKWLIDEERVPGCLKKLKFSVFGLGNSQYVVFNAMGRRTNQYLEKLGGKRIYRFGEGDDDKSLEDDFNEWKGQLWEELKKVCEPTSILLTETQQKNADNAKNKLPFTIIPTDQAEVNLEECRKNEDNVEYEFQMKQYLASTNVEVSLIRELRQNTDDGSTLHIELDVGSAGLTYRTADNLALFPENSPDTVAKMAKLLHLDLDEVFILTEDDSLESNIKFKYPFPTPISVRTYLTKFCDMTNPIKKKQLKDLSEFCSHKKDKEKLIYLTSANGKVEFEAQVQSRMWGLLEIIENFNVKIDLANLINISSLIQPRYYTIASSNKKNPKSLHLCATVHVDLLPDGVKRVGLTSAYLTSLMKTLQSGQTKPRMKVMPKESTFQLPQNSKVPVYMVGPGAGIAPFKAFVEEKDYYIKRKECNIPYGELNLYFGCRQRNKDYLYKDEMMQYYRDGTLTKYYTAFSREETQKNYVQNLLDINKDVVIKEIFGSNGMLYICGSMGMGKAVVAKMAEFAAIFYNIDIASATKKIEEMERNKTIIKELWG